jgi:hypothetical protein
MEEYQIRMWQCGQTKTSFSSIHLNDFAAVRRAEQLMQGGGEVEVWRDEYCVYARRDRSWL